MRIQFSKIALTATLGLALAFAISCSSDDEDKTGDGDKKNNNLPGGCYASQAKGYSCLRYDESWGSLNADDSMTKDYCKRVEGEYKSECPSNWTWKCIGSGAITYLYVDNGDDYSTSEAFKCTRK